MFETSEFTKRFDEVGIDLGDKIFIQPVNGRKKKITLKRTSFYFVTRHFENEMMSGCYCLLPEMRNEKFKLKLSLKETTTQTRAFRQRFYLEVEEGNPFKLNGGYHHGSFLERGDFLEIGYNRIYFLGKDNENFCEEDAFVTDQKVMIESDLTILLQGETGVGKSRMAKKIHEASGRNGRYMQLNLSAISPNLIESELFGHTKGSFTGAHQDKIGALKKADYGTLFLDEIDSLPKDIQTKLLLFLDDQTITPVGGGPAISLNVRLVVASGRNLSKVVQDGEMRQDFYYRISNGISFKMASLRDEPARIKAFCEKFAIQKRVKITPRLIEFYETLPWPGNYRQLKGHLESKLVMANGKSLDFDHFDEKQIQQSSELSHLGTMERRPSLAEVKQAYVRKIYFECEKNATQAAKVLNISSKCLRGMMKQTKNQLHIEG